MRLAVIGLGKLGSPLAAVLASKGHEVIGVDLNPEHIRKLNAGIAPVAEPGLQELIDAGRTRLRATADICDAVANSDISFVIVPTPSDQTGFFTNRHVVAAVTKIGEALRDSSHYHVVNITSTVMPGSTAGEIAAALEASSGRKVGDTVGLCYNPEFIALGSVVRDMLHPDMILLGQSDDRAGAMLAEVYRTSCNNNPPIRRMSLLNAEIVKISINTYVTMKISYANTLAGLCERLPGADVDIVTQAIGLDSRIGTKYLRGAVGFGGPCFPRDTVAFSALARQLDIPADLAEATGRINEYQTERLTALVSRLLQRGGTVGILGLSYKPDTAVIEESPSIALALALSRMQYKVIVHDPEALGPALAVLGNKVDAAPSAPDCIAHADLLVIMTPWREYRQLGRTAFAGRMRRLPIIDCWRVLDPVLDGDVADLVYLGFGTSLTEASSTPRASTVAR